MQNKQSALIALFLFVVLLMSSLSLVAAAANNTRSTNLSGGATFNLTTVFYGRNIASPQPSPYCNVGTAASPFDLMCYTPQDLKTAYNYPSYLSGAGQTIVIVDAYGSPTVQSDLNTFDSTFNLPPTTIQIVCQAGSSDKVGPCPTFEPNGWTGEIALDTQYSHAMAPGAHIVLMVASSSDDLVIQMAVQAAVNMFPHSIISQSFGDPELDIIDGTCTLGEVPFVPCGSAYVHELLTVGEASYKQAAFEGTTVFASAGDYGADNSGLCPYPTATTCEFTSANPSWPSSSPWVTAVGGTMGNPYYVGAIPSCSGFTCSTGLVKFLNTPSCQLNTETPTSTASCIPVGYGGEQVWNEPFIDAATGGAPSLIFGVPFYQYGLGLTSRTTPDVSYNAAVSGGVLGVIGGLFYIIGGTSAGSPQWAAIAALADQLAGMQHKGTIGFINPALYAIGENPFLYQRDFHDITVGNNIVASSPDNVGFYAHPGWDDASGWGTPNVANLVPELVALSY